MRGLLPGLLLVVACAPGPADTEVRDTATHGYTGPFGITEVTSECEPGTPDRWRVFVRTEGWAGGVDLHVVAGDEAEVHPMSNVGFDPGGTWDEYEAVLYAVTDAEAVDAGATTRWGCGGSDTLARKAVMYLPDSSGDIADCAIWGPGSASAFAGEGCTCVAPDEDCS